MGNWLNNVVGKLQDPSFVDSARVFGAHMRNDYQSADAISQSMSERMRRQRELMDAARARKEEIELRKQEKIDDREFTVAERIAGEKAGFETWKLQKQYEASNPSAAEQQQLAVSGANLQKAYNEAVAENERREALGLEPLPLPVLPSASYSQPTSTPAQQPASDGSFDRDIEIIAQIESGGRDFNDDGQYITSPKGAKGIMQVTDATARNPGYGIDPIRDDSPEERARVGREYWPAMVKEFGGNKEMAAAAYNAGPGRVQDAAVKYGDAWKDHIPGETKDYIQKFNKLSQAQQNPAPTSTPVTPTVSSTPQPRTPTGQLNAARTARIQKANGVILADDGVTPVPLKGYTGIGYDPVTMQQINYIDGKPETEQQKLQTINLKGQIDERTTKVDKEKKEKVEANNQAINVATDQIRAIEKVTQEDVDNVGGISAQIGGDMYTRPSIQGSAQKFQVVMAKEFLNNIEKMKGNGSLSNAEGAKLTGPFAGLVKEDGSFKLGISEKVLADALKQARAGAMAVKESRERVAEGKDPYSPKELDAAYEKHLADSNDRWATGSFKNEPKPKDTKAPTKEERENSARKAQSGYTQKQQELLDKY